VHTASLAFELVLLSRMNDHYKDQILEKANLTSEEAIQIRRQCRLQYLDLFKSTVSDYEQMLVGVEIRMTSSNSTNTELWETRRIDLILWPHMEWEFFSLNGIVWTGHFRNRQTISPNASDLNSLQAGAWCQDQLEAIALKVQFLDGWSEQMMYQLDFVEGCYEGDFVFQLLQTWRKLI
jgi:hypothetical protein